MIEVAELESCDKSSLKADLGKFLVKILAKLFFVETKDS